MSQERTNQNCLNEEEELDISESEMEEGKEQMENWRKCSLCNLPCSGHEGTTGALCELDVLDTPAKLKDYYKELKEKLKGKKKKNKTSRKEGRTTGVQPGTATSGSVVQTPGVNTAPPIVTQGAGGQVTIDAGVLQQHVAAIQTCQGGVISPTTAGAINSQGLERDRRGSTTSSGGNNMNQQQWNKGQFQQQK